MDTKLKNSEPKYHSSVKFVAILLTAATAFLTGMCGLNFLRTAVFYADEKGGVTGTPAFQEEITDTLISLSDIKGYVGFLEGSENYESFLKTKSAKEIIEQYDKREQRAVELFEKIQEHKKSRPTSIKTVDGTYDIDEYGNVYIPEEDIYVSFEDFLNSYSDESAASISTFKKWYDEYQELRAEIFDLVDVAKSVDQIKNDINTLKEQELLDIYYTASLSVMNCIDGNTNIKFILKDNKSGKIISNVEANKRNDFIKNLNSNAVYCINFDGKELHSKPLTVNESSNLLKFLTDANILDNRSIDQDMLLSYFEGYSLYLKIDSGNLAPGDTCYKIISTYQNLPNASESALLGLTVLFATLSCIGFVSCCVMSGRRKDGSAELVVTDKIPLIIHSGFTAVIIFFGVVGIGCLAVADFSPRIMGIYGDSPLRWIVTDNSVLYCVSLLFALVSLFLLSFVLYLARNIKAKTLSNRLISVFVLKKIFNTARTLKARLSARGISRKNIKRQSVTGLAIYVVVNALLYLISFSEAFPLALICLAIFNTLAIVYGFLYFTDIHRLSKIAEEIRNGNFNTKIEPKTFVAPLRKFAVDMDACREGIENAVNEAVKGEHLKTELITNVSHDLKTPLTSIINYVSLLKMSNIQGDDERKYIDILDEKSKKLKRLIEDLTEASKANSGNIKMNIAQVNLNELALQAVGENSDVLENAGLDIVLTERDKEIIVAADSQHTFRIIDNLFSNARKYSLTGTRVYVDVYKENNRGVFVMKNISSEKLNIDPEELTERFVRGDNSRTTDGSGLGLSIARSFAELQNGEFSIEIDGDMFKAVVKLPLI